MDAFFSPKILLHFYNTLGIVRFIRLWPEVCMVGPCSSSNVNEYLQAEKASVATLALNPYHP